MELTLYRIFPRGSHLQVGKVFSSHSVFELIVMEAIVSFEEWFEVISTLDSSEARWDVDDRISCLPPTVVADYLRRLFLDAPVLCRGITSARLCHMIWFFNGVCSSYWHEVRSKDVPIEMQISTVLALGNFYRDFLDHYPLGDDFDASEAETAVYMMWDMDCLEGAAIFPGEEHLVNPIFEVLGTALRCKSFGCQRSALHGLGHQEPYHPERVHAEIDWVLSQEGRLHPLLISYAHDARTGMIQ